MLLFSFSIFSDRRSLKIEIENNTKTLTAEVSNRTRIIETYSGWLELSLTGTNFHGPKSVRGTEVLLYVDIYIIVCSPLMLVISGGLAVPGSSAGQQQGNTGNSYI